MIQSDTSREHGPAASSTPRPWILRSSWRLYGSLFLLVAIPMGVLVLSIAVHVRSQLEDTLREQNTMHSRLLATAMDEELRGMVAHVSSVASRRLLIEAINTGDGEKVAPHLQALLGGNLSLRRAFVTDLAGVLWHDLPHDPDVIGRDFSHRDWYQGARSRGGPYISEFYQRSALGEAYVVAIAVPVRDGAGNAIGYLVGQYELEDMRQRMAMLSADDSTMFAIVDHRGQTLSAYIDEVLTNGQRSLPVGVIDVSQAGSQVAMLFEDGEKYLVSISPINGTQWMAVAKTSLDVVNEPVRSLMTTIVVLFIMMCIGVSLFGVALTRTLWRFNTALRKAEGEQRRAKEEAEAANATKSKFLASMSHEIRTPMSAIVGYVELLNEPSCSRESVHEAVRVIRRNADHLLTVINDILDISKIEAGELHVERVQCSPCRLLHDVLSMMRVPAAEKGLDFRARVEGVIPETIISDPTRLRQILINLVGNAVKFTDAGSVSITTMLEERGTEHEPMLRFDIADTGIGIDAARLHRLFQPFVQADSSMTRRFGGSGLGLVISSQLARMLGGGIEVKSEANVGSTFTVRIATGSLDGVSLLRSCGEAMVDSDDGEQMHAQPARLSGCILLVEDGKDNRDLLAHYLRIAGAEVVEAENGQIACERIEQGEMNGRPFDAVILDMQMPVLDGYSAAQRMREMNYNKPIIALTAHAMPQDRERCIRAGCTDYLSKPVSSRRLYRTLAKYVPAPVEDGTATTTSPTEATANGGMDESIREYQDAFFASLPGRAAELQKLLIASDFEAMGEVLHQIKGSGGLFGLMSLTHQAEAVELALQQEGTIQDVRAQVQQLIAMLQHVKVRDDESVESRLDGI